MRQMCATRFFPARVFLACFRRREFICANLFCRGFRGASTYSATLSNSVGFTTTTRTRTRTRESTHTPVQLLARAECDSTVSRLPHAHLFTEETWCRVYKGGRISPRISTAAVKPPRRGVRAPKGTQWAPYVCGGV